MTLDVAAVLSCPGNPVGHSTKCCWLSENPRQLVIKQIFLAPIVAEKNRHSEHTHTHTHTLQIRTHTCRHGHAHFVKETERYNTY